jgi:hypothetical protein
VTIRENVLGRIYCAFSKLYATQLEPSQRFCCFSLFWKTGCTVKVPARQQSFIDRIADALCRRLLEGVPEEQR